MGIFFKNKKLELRPEKILFEQKNKIPFEIKDSFVESIIKVNKSFSILSETSNPMNIESTHKKIIDFLIEREKEIMKREIKAYSDHKETIPKLMETDLRCTMPDDEVIKCNQ